MCVPNPNHNCSDFTIQREIDRAFLEVDKILAKDELGGRRRKVYYRERFERSSENMILGIPGEPLQNWTRITPTPSTFDYDRKSLVKDFGVLQVGDIEMRVNRLSISRQVLENSEFFIDDNPDGPGPMSTTKANYDVIGGSVQEGGGDTRGRFVSDWVCSLRRRQS